MKKIIILLLCLCGCKLQYGPITNYVDKVDQKIIKVIYCQYHMCGNEYEITDETCIEELVDAVYSLNVVDEVNEVATDYDDILIFVCEDGSEYFIRFNYKHLEIKDENGNYHYYEVDNFDGVIKILDAKKERLLFLL